MEVSHLKSPQPLTESHQPMLGKAEINCPIKPCPNCRSVSKIKDSYCVKPLHLGVIYYTAIVNETLAFPNVSEAIRRTLLNRFQKIIEIECSYVLWWSKGVNIGKCVTKDKKSIPNSYSFLD